METLDIKPEPDCSTGKEASKHFQPKHATVKQNRNYAYKSKELRANSKEDSYINEKLACITGPTVDLPALKQTEQKFSGRSRLYIGNLPLNVTEEDINNLFKKFGETNDIFLNKSKNFGFIKLDYYANALRAKSELNGYSLKGRILIVRFAHPASVMVKNLPSFVSDELLYLAFSIFGEIERCLIIIDDRGKSIGKGIVQYVKKSSAAAAVSRCSENCYFITSSLKPVVVENYEPINDTDGLPESALRKTPEYYQSREAPPRFAVKGSFEHNYGIRWKELHLKYKEKIASLKNELFYEEQKLEADMIRAQYDHETERLKEMLRVRELEMDRFKQEWELRHRQLQNERIHQKVSVDDTGRLRQQDTLYLQASRLSNLLDREERQLQEQWSMVSCNADTSYPGMSSSSSNAPEIWRNHADVDSCEYNRVKRLRH